MLLSYVINIILFECIDFNLKVESAIYNLKNKWFKDQKTTRVSINNEIELNSIMRVRIFLFLRCTS